MLSFWGPKFGTMPIVRRTKSQKSRKIRTNVHPAAGIYYI